MIVIAGFVIGVLLGLRAARKRGGNRLDMLQYGAVHGLIFALLGLFLAILIDRLTG